jgi:(E)-4-hydroxy-3-methylbut-2-enyl-diphosphate synthase
MTKKRNKTREVKIGSKIIGGRGSISVQSMLSIPSSNLDENIAQAKRLQNAGCEILRIAVPNKDALKLIPAVKKNVSMPIVADIHFDAELAIDSVHAGADKIRINPGNISKEGIKQIVKICESKKVPIRVGINSGSLERKVLAKFGNACSEALAESAFENIKILENLNFNNIVVSIKSSCVRTCVEAYRIVASQCIYPLHVGITESGTPKTGIIKSAIGIGTLLLSGIGDTIRVSLSGDPEKEVETGITILKSLGLRSGITVISCPACGRASINIFKIAEKLESKLEYENGNRIFTEKNIKVAIMGCPVNGPGEAGDADLAITGAGGMGIIFKKGIPVKKMPEEKLIDEIFNEIKILLKT